MSARDEVVDVLGLDGPMTTKSLCERVDFSRRQIQRTLEALVRDGEVVASTLPGSREAFYEIGGPDPVTEPGYDPGRPTTLDLAEELVEIEKRKAEILDALGRS